MTYGENKKITLNLIEEYSKDSKALTEDEDISTRLYALYNTAMQELAQNKKIRATKTYNNISEKDEYISFLLPSDLYQIKKLISLDESNTPKNIQYYTLGKKIYIKSQKNGSVVLEYYRFPDLLKEDTKDDYYLDLEQDVLMILPYAVAGDILKTDPSSDYTAFSAEYQRKLNSLDNRQKSPSVIIKEGVL